MPRLDKNQRLIKKQSSRATARKRNPALRESKNQGIHFRQTNQGPVLSVFHNNRLYQSPLATPDKALKIDLDGNISLPNKSSLKPSKHSRIGTDFSTNDLTLSTDISGDIRLRPSQGSFAGNVICDLVNGVLRVGVGDTTGRFEVHPGSAHITHYANDDDYWRIEVHSNGDCVLKTHDEAGMNANLTLNIDGDIELNADGGNIIFKDDTTTMLDVQTSVIKSEIPL